MNKRKPGPGRTGRASDFGTSNVTLMQPVIRDISILGLDGTNLLSGLQTTVTGFLERGSDQPMTFQLNVFGPQLTQAELDTIGLKLTLLIQSLEGSSPSSIQ